MRSRSLKIGDTIADRRVDALIGRGGMGVVYRAWNTRLERAEALKVITDDLASDAGFRERFLSEARIAVKLEHPHVIPVYDAAEAKGGLLFMSMRYIEDGNTMASLIAQRERLDPGTAAKIISGIASALDHAHGQGLVHRDVKPANILIAAQTSQHPYLTDFGLSKRASSNTVFSGGGSVVGTVDYMSPEQGQGELVDARTDIYALGVTLFEALTGKLPYVRDSDVAVLAAKVLEPAPMVTQMGAGIPSAFDAVLARALARDPAERYSSAGELGRAAMDAAGRPSTVTTTKEVGVGSVLADCVIEEIAGKGGMAVVYKATDKLDRTVALKVMAPELADDPDFRVRFEREWKIAAVIDHPNVIPVYWAGESRGRLFIVMRYVDGETLRDTLARRGQLDPELAVEVIEQLAAALDEAHSRGLVHRDIKPGNVLIEEATGRVFLSDFGLAQDVGDAEAAADGNVLGTVRYLPPERGRDDVVDDVLGDIYSLGLVLQEMLGGVARVDLDRVQGVPSTLARVVDRAAAEDPTARFASAGELARAARQALDPDAQVEEAPRGEDVPATIPAGPGAADRRQPFEPKPLSHGLRERVIEVCDTVLRLVSPDSEARSDLEAVRNDLSAPLRLAVIGDPGSGRSTLINAILGRRLTETGSLAGLAPTVTLEHGVPERTVAVAPDGAESEYGLRPDGTLPEEVTNSAGQLADLRVRLPLDALRTVSLIHTSLPQDTDETLAGADPGDAADAYLITWPADSLDELAQASTDLFARLGGLRASSVNATIVPTKADLAGEGAGIDAAAAGFGHAVGASAPVAALLAETAKLDRVTSDDVAALGQLASELEAEYEELLSSREGFLTADVSLSREEREELLDRYGLLGIRCALELADADQLSGTDLKRRLRAVSGLSHVDLQIAGFHQRADALKADAALTRLDDLSYRWPDLDFLRDHVEAARLEPQMHIIDLIHAFERCAVDHVDVPDDLVESLECFIKGRTAADRLGLEGDPEPEELRAAALEGFRAWKMFAEAGSASRAASRVALDVARSYEIVGRESSGGEQAAG
jgi:serine/threonine protein kinase